MGWQVQTGGEGEGGRWDGRYSQRERGKGKSEGR